MHAAAGDSVVFKCIQLLMLIIGVWGFELAVEIKLFLWFCICAERWLWWLIYYFGIILFDCLSTVCYSIPNSVTFLYKVIKNLHDYCISKNIQNIKNQKSKSNISMASLSNKKTEPFVNTVATSILLLTSCILRTMLFLIQSAIICNKVSYLLFCTIIIVTYQLIHLAIIAICWGMCCFICLPLYCTATIFVSVMYYISITVYETAVLLIGVLFYRIIDFVFYLGVAMRLYRSYESTLSSYEKLARRLSKKPTIKTYWAMKRWTRAKACKDGNIDTILIN